MEVLFFCPRWGSENVAWEKWLPKVKQAGYDGVEWAIDRDVTREGIEKIIRLGEQHGLRFIAQHFDTTMPDVDTHVLYYVDWLKKVEGLPFVRINSQTGLDYYPFAQNKMLIDLASEYGVIHETHRGKFSFAAHITREYLERIPSLRLTLDASHWVNVSESLLENQQATMQLAIERTDHIHARIGYPEGPQVPHPCSKEWEAALASHLAWWDAVIERKKRMNIDVSITPEFGPFPYMVHHPRTGEPVSDQWTINVWMMEFLKHRYA